MCFCIFTLVFTYIMSALYHQSPPFLPWCRDGDRCSAGLLLIVALCVELMIDTGDHGNKRAVSPETHTYVSLNHPYALHPGPGYVIHFTAKCSLSL